MKNILILSALTWSPISIAAPVSYDCEATDEDGADNYFEVTLTQYSAIIYTAEGEEYSIDREERSNERNLRFALYIDRAYDGYGGFVKLSIPANVADSESPVKKSFTTYFTVSMYSEAGHVSTTELTGKCKLAVVTEEFQGAAKQAERLANLIPTALWYSESEYGWSPFYSHTIVSDRQWNNKKINDLFLPGLVHVDEWSHKEVVDLLKDASTDEALSQTEHAEYATLLKALSKEFKELRGFKVGTPDSGALDIYIVGRNAEGFVVGVRTISVET